MEFRRRLVIHGCQRCGGTLARDEDDDWRCFSCGRSTAPPAELVQPDTHSPRLPMRTRKIDVDDRRLIVAGR